MNTVDPTGSIIFTREDEENNSMPFLDAKFTRKKDGSVKSTVDRKKTHTDQYLNFVSHQPKHQKLGVVRTLIHRCETITSEEGDKKEEVEHLREALRVCGYPSWALNKVTDSNVKYNAASPAVTLDYTSSWDNKEYSIDLVPAIEFDGFPVVSKKKLRNSWIPEEYIDGLCEKIHVVAKTHSSEQRKMPSRRILWRLSFSAAEKQIIYRADGLFAAGQQTCRKDVLRLMKTDLLNFYATQQGNPREFCSYYLKVLMLNLYDKIPSNAMWEKSTMLVPRYVDALHYWQQILRERLLPYYFTRRENLLEQTGLVEGADSQLLALLGHVTTLLATYGD
ncbi:hypothetical protein LSAT2_018059 [Lamellibrachia satsuma]|nr:hypothetical protein LSAT2_018059 [Lamellibrachia satsuma]